MQAVIKAIEYHLPERSLTNSQLIAEFPEWSTEKIEQKTGIAERRIAAEDECSSDLGVAAAQKLFSSGACQPGEIDYILLCTQTPDYFLPTTACIMQERLDIPTAAGALDFNLGCSGYVYGLGLAKGLIETGQARNVLLITAETYSKLLSPDDKSVRAIFGDAAAATLITGTEQGEGRQGEWIGPFVFGTDGRGAQNLIVPAGGMRKRYASTDLSNDVDGNRNPDDFLYMNGPEIFTFTLQVVPPAVEKLLTQARKGLGDIDLFVFHQANKYMLDYLRKKMKIPEEKFYVAMRDCGNTVCSTIPIALKHASEEERLRPGQQAMLVGFGVGYSWGGTLIRWA